LPVILFRRDERCFSKLTETLIDDGFREARGVYKLFEASTSGLAEGEADSSRPPDYLFQSTGPRYRNVYFE
jgi:hypothetical protein